MINSGSWSRPRWWAMVVLIFVLQVVLIFGLSSRSAIKPRPVTPAPELRFAGAGWNEVLAMMDPAFFALPRAQGFSGRAWAPPSPSPVRPFAWSNEDRWLAMDANQLGQTFSDFVATYEVAPLHEASFGRPALVLPQGTPLTHSRDLSTVRVEGDLSRRKWLNSPTLPPQAFPELLTNTVVQLVTDWQGRTVSATLLSSSLSPEADQLALETARKARFEATDGNAATHGSPMGNLTWGRMIFEWQTVPLPMTNEPSTVP